MSLPTELGGEPSCLKAPFSETVSASLDGRRLWLNSRREMATCDGGGQRSFRRADARRPEALGAPRASPEAYLALATRLETEDSPEMHPVWVIEDADGIAGFYELRERGGHVELLRMFQRPWLIGQGMGGRLWDHAASEAQWWQTG